MNVREILIDYLIGNGFDGLFNEDGTCACSIDELCACGDPTEHCQPGIKVPCDCPEHCDYHIGPRPDGSAPSVEEKK